MMDASCLPTFRVAKVFRSFGGSSKLLEGLVAREMLV